MYEVEDNDAAVVNEDMDAREDSQTAMGDHLGLRPGNATSRGSRFHTSL